MTPPLTQSRAEASRLRAELDSALQRVMDRRTGTRSQVSELHRLGWWSYSQLHRSSVLAEHDTQWFCRRCPHSVEFDPTAEHEGGAEWAFWLEVARHMDECRTAAFEAAEGRAA